MLAFRGVRTPADFARAARASGCVLRGVEPGPVTTIARFQCVDGWQSARLLAALAEQSSRDPSVVRLARRLKERAPDAHVLARMLHRFVQTRVTFVRETVETFRGAGYLAERIATNGYWIGDCDCSADLLFAIARAAGLPARFRFFAKGGQPAHVATQIGEQTREGFVWQWAETTLRGAAFGEHPLSAAKRLGVIDRSDLETGKKAAMGGDLLPAAQVTGRVYAARLRVAPDADAEAIRAALEGAGASNVSVWTEAASVPPSVVRLVGGGAPDDARAAWARWTWDGGDGSIAGVLEGDVELAVVAGAGDENVTSPAIGRVAGKANALVTAYVQRYGDLPTKHAALLLLAVADLETAMGDYRGNIPGAILPGPSHNWGQIQFAPLNADEQALFARGVIPAPRNAHVFLSGDTSPDTGAYRVWLWRFDTDVQGATKLLEVIVDHEQIRAALATMTPSELAASMYAAHYFEGSASRAAPGGPAKNIAAYGGGIARHYATLAAALDDWTPDMQAPSLLADVMTVGLVGVGLGALVAQMVS